MDLLTFLPELHEVRGLGNQILQRGRKEHRIPQPTPEVPGGVTAQKALSRFVRWLLWELLKAKIGLVVVYERVLHCFMRA